MDILVGLAHSALKILVLPECTSLMAQHCYTEGGELHWLTHTLRFGFSSTLNVDVNSPQFNFL